MDKLGTVVVGLLLMVFWVGTTYSIGYLVLGNLGHPSKVFEWAVLVLFGSALLGSGVAVCTVAYHIGAEVLWWVRR